MADIHVSMSLRMRLYWLHSKKKWKRSSISPQLHKGFSIMFFSRDGDVRYYSLFSVLHDRFVQVDFLENIVFEVG